MERGEVTRVTSGSGEIIRYVDRDHTWPQCIFIASGLSLCITVDILQYSMPLAFLPSVLEDRGHSTMKIATAIGVYYWTGFLGGFLLTSYQLYRMMYQRQKKATAEVADFETVQRHIWFLVVGLAIGTLTLFTQALSPTWAVHTSCRFLQGFAGAFIFFYTFLLSVALFKDQQQVVAMTFASCALNVAEVFGSFIGAALYDVYGQRAVFWFLGIVSLFNQVFLFAILYAIRATEEQMISRTTSYMGSSVTPTPRQTYPHDGPDAAGGPQRASCGCLPPVLPGAMDKFRGIMESRPLACANLLIATAAVVKGSVEEMLPFHADHRWHMTPLEIGKLFCTIAIAYIFAAGFTGQFWTKLGRFQVCFAAFWLFMLGVIAWLTFACVKYWPDTTMLSFFLAAYGVCLGMTHTPAALLLASVIDHEEGPAKDAVNGIWNTTWEAGGSIGFLLGGLLAERYHEQMALLTWYSVLCAASALTMIAISVWPEEGLCIKPGKDPCEAKLNGYGTTSPPGSEKSHSARSYSPA